MTNTDCPSQYTWYTLTVTECTGTGAFTIDQVTFYRGT